jgi:DNA-binding NtrC family response regulator
MDAARKANIMFVDDEKRVLSSMRALFRRDYNVHLANSGNEALELLERQDMDVIVSDQRMPGMTGVDVLKACKVRAPRAMRILLTGYADKDAIEASINEGEVFRYLTKPCARETLRETLALAVDAAGVSDAPEPARPTLTLVSDVDPADDTQTPETTAGTTRTASASPLGRMRELTRSPSSTPAATELMVLSADSEFTAALEGALGMAYRMHTVQSVVQAMGVLEENPIGVLITDMAINGDEVQALTAELKHCVPELVTIVASDHSDAHRLIDLINGGQVFRFLLKPIKPRQTAIWIDSAVGKHLELVSNPGLLARHAVAAPAESLLQLGDRLIRNLAGRILRLRGAGTVQPGESR